MWEMKEEPAKLREEHSTHRQEGLQNNPSQGISWFQWPVKLGDSQAQRASSELQKDPGPADLDSNI